MGPVLILDKSTLQSLSSDELIFLNKYFIVNIPPVLIMEICGDLSKRDKQNSISKDQVQLLAQKIYRGISGINAHFSYCIHASLLGEKVPMEGRILLLGGSYRMTESGEKGVVFEETPEQRQLNRWKSGDFDSEEQIIAKQWREASKVIDLETTKKNFTKKFKSLININSLAALKSYVPTFLADSTHQTDFLIQLIMENNIPQTLASKIFLRYEQSNKPLLSTFAPYAYYCYHIKTFFLLACIFNLISTRSTNIIDLEYFFYLPFCTVFSSSDKFHQILVPFYIRNDQRFISGADLKAGLAHFVKDWSVKFHKDMKAWDAEYGSGPPENSVVYNLWKELNPNWIPGKNSNSSPSEPDSIKKINKRMDEFNKAKASKDIDFHSDDSKIDFIIRRYSISIDDPCPCGSGKKLKDCHLPEIRENEKQAKSKKEIDEK